MLSVETSDVSRCQDARCETTGRGNWWDRLPRRRCDRSRNIARRRWRRGSPTAGFSGSAGGLNRTRTNVAEGARHAHAIGPNQVFRCSKKDRRSSAAGPISSRQPRRSLDSGTAAIRRCRWHSRRYEPSGRFLPRAPILTPGYFALVLERIRRTIRAALIEPQSVTIGIGAGGFFKARLIDQAQIIPAIVAS